MSSAKHRHYKKTPKSSGKCFIYGKLLRHANKFHCGFSYVTHYIKHSFLGTRRVISSIITRNFFVTRNKPLMTIGTNRMCISRDDNCANTMCFPRQFPTNARKLFTTCVIRVVISVSYLLVSYFAMNFLRRIFSPCHSFRSMC